MMWTVCWVDENGSDKWERIENKKDVIEHLQNLKEKGIALEDAIVFPPDTEEYIPELLDCVDWNEVYSGGEV